MTNYTKSTNFASKDSLASGNALKIVKGTELDTEFNNIATAVATKAESASPTFTGTPTAPTASSGTNTTQLATTAFVKAANDTQDTAIALKAPIASPAFTGVPTAPTATADSSSTQVATTAFVISQAATAAPLIGGTASVGTSKKYAREDHVHPIPVISSATVVNTTSGTEANYTSIPSWVKRITVLFSNVSTSGTSRVIVQLGSGSITTSGYTGGGYNSATGSVASSTGFTASTLSSATDTRTGSMSIQKLNGNNWVASGIIGNTSASISMISGDITLSGTLDRLRITTVGGTDTFDAGSVNILYE